MYSFWAATVKPLSTPSETCLPHHLTITTAALDEAAETLPEGSRISVWATQKERGPRGSVTVAKTLICTLACGRTETVACKTQFHNSTLLSFHVQPQKASCAVHLAGFFDHKYDKAPDVGDQMTWSEFQELLADARAMEEEEDEEDAGAEQVSAEEKGGRPVRAARQDPAAKKARSGSQGDDDELDEVEAGPPAPVKGKKEKGSPVAVHKPADGGAAEDVGSKRKRAESTSSIEKKQKPEEKKKKPSGAVKATKSNLVKLEDGVSYSDEELGFGKVVKSGSVVTLKMQKMKGKSKEGEEVTRKFMVGLRKVASGCILNAAPGTEIGFAAPSLDTALVGMRGGGRRTIHLGEEAHDAQIHEGWGVGEDISLAVSAVKVG